MKEILQVAADAARRRHQHLVHDAEYQIQKCQSTLSWCMEMRVLAAQGLSLVGRLGHRLAHVVLPAEPETILAEITKLQARAFADLVYYRERLELLPEGLRVVRLIEYLAHYEDVPIPELGWTQREMQHWLERSWANGARHLSQKYDELHRRKEEEIRRLQRIIDEQAASLRRRDKAFGEIKQHLDWQIVHRQGGRGFQAEIQILDPDALAELLSKYYD